MKGKKTFTNFEIRQIKKLIAEKILASPEKQKSIRQNIRNIGFHYSDFSHKRSGYTVADFEALVLLGLIKIENGKYVDSSPVTKPIGKPDIVAEKFPVKQSIKRFESILANFKANRFDPKINNKTIIANSSGNYIICLKKVSKLPDILAKPILTQFDGLQVLYTGIASVSLRTRDFKQHFKGNNAGRSTLRKSLGVLFGYNLIPRDSDPNTGKKKFGNADEIKLSEWMCENLIMYFLPTSNFNGIEIELINHFNPPLNLKDKSNEINFDFRLLLSYLRAQKK
ncbi:MAG: hypothetical protein QM764_20675 [Chitinophagaceae bacterium]